MAQNTHLRAIRSFYSTNHGLVTLEDDVLSIVRQVREEYGDRVSIELDPDTAWFHFVAHEHGKDTLIFSTDCLDPRALDRLRRSDSHARGFEDPYLAVEREQDAAQAAIDRAHAEKVKEHGEELIFHLQNAGRAPFLPKKVYLPRGINADA